MSEEKSERLIASLQQPDLFPHPVERFEVVKTHISFVLLTGRYAYKLFRPVAFDFLDFSSLEERRENCLRELRLNRRLAPDLYLEVLPVTGTVKDPVINGGGEPVEYLVKMKEFPGSRRMDRMLDRGEVSEGMVDQVARKTGRFHDRAGDDPPRETFGSPDLLRTQVFDAAEDLRSRLRESPKEARVATLIDRLKEVFQSQRNRVRRRHASGCVREGHGDLHLENMVYWQDRVSIFDCVEFDPALRWIDVMNDAAFLKMDFHSRNRDPYAWRWINRYLEWTGDYGGVPLLPLFQAYRAVVRALVHTIRSDRDENGSNPEQAAGDRVRNLLSTAEKAIEQPPEGGLLLMHGLSGSGKTTLSGSLLEQMGGYRIRSDVERKRLHGLSPGESPEQDAAFGEGMYSTESTDRTYNRLLEAAGPVVQTGETVFLDATYLRERHRKQALEQAREWGVPAAILYLKAEESTLEQRLREREAGASDADPSVLRKQTKVREPLTAAERERTIEVKASSPPSTEALSKKIRSRLAAQENGR